MATDYTIRRRGGFLDRNGLISINKVLQIDDFDDRTRIALKNKTIDFLDNYQKHLGISWIEYQARIAHKLAEELFCISINSRAASYSAIYQALCDVFDERSYGEILDTIEYLVNNFKIYKPAFSRSSGGLVLLDMESEFNKVFEQEYVGHRFIKGIITPITNQEEILSVTQAASGPYSKVSDHMVKALQLLSSRDSKNYKTAIAECSHALECLLNILSGQTKKSLGDALKDYLKSSQNVHPALANSIKDFYGYASDSPGIRHDTNGPDFGESFDEAKLVLVYTSAVINFLVSTAHK